MCANFVKNDCTFTNFMKRPGVSFDDFRASFVEMIPLIFIFLIIQMMKMMKIVTLMKNLTFTVTRCIVAPSQAMVDIIEMHSTSYASESFTFQQLPFSHECEDNIFNAPNINQRADVCSLTPEELRKFVL